MAERSYGVTVPVDPADSSQLCSGCGCVVRKDLSVRTHYCPVCGLVLDRDVNAARTVLKRGLEIGRGPPEYTLGGEVATVRLSVDTQVASVNQEAHDLSHG